MVRKVLKNTDVRISDTVMVAQCVIYKKDSNKGIITCRLVDKTLEKFRKYLDFPKSLVVRVCSFKSKQTRGRYFCDEEVVELGYNQSWDRALETLAHELVHAQQYYTGTLEQKLINRKWVYHYKGDPVFDRGSTYKSYRALPWEKEAFSQQKKLADFVKEDMESEYEESHS